MQALLFRLVELEWFAESTLRLQEPWKGESVGAVYCAVVKDDARPPVPPDFPPVLLPLARVLGQRPRCASNLSAGAATAADRASGGNTQLAERRCPARVCPCSARPPRQGRPAGRGCRASGCRRPASGWRHGVHRLRGGVFFCQFVGDQGCVRALRLEQDEVRSAASPALLPPRPPTPPPTRRAEGYTFRLHGQALPL